MLIVEKNNIDLGPLKFGDPYKFEFEVTNPTDKDVVIKHIHVSCSSCTKANCPKKIKSNSTAKVDVTYTPGVVGNSNKHIDIVFDDNQRVTLSFKAFINGQS